MKTKLPTTRFYAPILRKEKQGDVLIVEAYAYVNPKVKSDRYNLTRAAMEAASDAYAQFPAIREMHGSNAAGTGLEIEWDERGCKLTCKVVDAAAIKKVEEEVYRGLSVGVKPTLLRGSDVVSCDWIETSLVDRPADPDAIILSTRGEELPPEVEVETETETEEEVARAAFAEQMKKTGARVLKSRAVDVLCGVLYDALLYNEADAQSRTTAMDAALNEFRAYVLPMMARGEMFIAPGEDGVIARSDVDRDYVARADHEREISALRSERETARADLTSERGRSATLERRVEELERTPVATAPVRYPEALQRTFAANAQERTEADEAREELARIEGIPRAELLGKSQEERDRLSLRVTQLKQTITRGA